jgi:hypothetical protein
MTRETPTPSQWRVHDLPRQQLDRPLEGRLDGEIRRAGPDRRPRDIAGDVERHRVDAEPAARPVGEAPCERGLERLAPADHAHVVAHGAAGTHGVQVHAAGGGGERAGAGAGGELGRESEAGLRGRDGAAEAHLALAFAGDEEGF